MKKFSLILALISAGLVSVSANAAGQANINSSATVTGSCSFIQSDAELSFGTLDPSSGLDVEASTSLDYECTNGTQAVVVLNGGSDINNLVNGVSSIKQTLTTVGGNQVGQGYGFPLNYAVTGKILYADYAAAQAGLHTSTMVVTITP
jgi:spore coat protein U-like protein